MSNIEVAIQRAIEAKFCWFTSLEHVPRGVKVCILEDGTLGIGGDLSQASDIEWYILTVSMQDWPTDTKLEQHCTGNVVTG